MPSGTKKEDKGEVAPPEGGEERQQHAKGDGKAAPPKEGGGGRQHPPKRGKAATPPKMEHAKQHHPTEDKGKVASPRTPPNEGGDQTAPPNRRQGKSSPTQNTTQRRRRPNSTTVLKPGSRVQTEIDVIVEQYVQPEMLKLCQRESIYASDTHGCTKNSRTKIGAQRTMTNQNLRRDTNKQGKRASPRKKEEKCAKFFPRKSRKERNKFKKAENGNTNELTRISANVTSWKKNFNEVARLSPDTMALQETKVTKAAKPASNRAAGSEKLSVIWGTPSDQLKKKRKGKFVAETPWMGRQGGVSVLAKNELGILAGGMEGKASCEL